MRTQVITPEQLTTQQRPLEKVRWGGAVDTVGGELLAELCRTTHEWGNIASIGLAASEQFKTTVMPFILRGVSILGTSSTNCPTELRQRLWLRLANELQPRHPSLIQRETITLGQLQTTFLKMLNGTSQGRIIVEI